jgi:hypothetical protein
MMASPQEINAPQILDHAVVEGEMKDDVFNHFDL